MKIKMMSAAAAVCVLLSVLAAPSRAENTADRTAGAAEAAGQLQMRQVNASVWMCAYGDDIFIARGRRGSAESIVSLEKGETVYRFDHRIRIVGYLAGTVFFVNEGEDGDALGLLDLSKMEAAWLECGFPVEDTRASIRSGSGLLFVPVRKNREGYRYAAVGREGILRYEREAAAVSRGGTDYFFSGPYPVLQGIYNGVMIEDILVRDGEGKTEKLELAPASVPVAMFSVAGRVFLYCDKHGVLLSLVEPDREVKPLFSFDSLYYQSSVTAYDDTIFFSVRRYREWGPLQIGYLADGEDELEGLYAVSASDLSVRKINDAFYTGLYNLGGGCLYGCDETGRIWRIAFDGTADVVFEDDERPFF